LDVSDHLRRKLADDGVITYMASGTSRETQGAAMDWRSTTWNDVVTHNMRERITGRPVAA
jgi:hypothetical protein